ncbi:MAG: hypothetical protein HC787_08575 [Nostocaceae cyanobacterium CSU_2_110]|nr:hypothetical protein [Nostocaceae cyanobacterium CSU_2_110]
MSLRVERSETKHSPVGCGSSQHFEKDPLSLAMTQLILHTYLDSNISKLTYSVLFESEQHGRFLAVVLDLANCKNTG